MQNASREYPDTDPGGFRPPSRRRGGAGTRERRTIEVGVRRLRDEASELIRRVRLGDRVVITRRRRPVAVLLSIDEAIDFVLANAEEFVDARVEARDRTSVELRNPE